MRSEIRLGTHTGPSGPSGYRQCQMNVSGLTGAPESILGLSRLPKDKRPQLDAALHIANTVIRHDNAGHTNVAILTKPTAPMPGCGP